MRASCATGLFALGVPISCHPFPTRTKPAAKSREFSPWKNPSCRSQLFRDGNKRTAQLVANDILVHSGEGVLTVPIDAQGEFFELLVAFYESNIPDELISFLREKCIEKPAIGKVDSRRP